MACEKKRRRMEPGFWRDMLESSLPARIVLVMFISGILGALCFCGEQMWTVKRESFVMSQIIFGTSLLLIFVHYPEIHRRHSRLLLFYLVILMNLFLTKLVGIYFQDWSLHLASPLAPYLVPAAFAPMLLTVLAGTGPGILAAMFTPIFSAILLPMHFSNLMLVGVTTGLMSVVLCRNVRKRGHLIRAGAYVGLAGLLCSVGMGIAGMTQQDELRVIAQQIVCAAIVGLGTGILANMLLPVFEAFFQITTHLSWLEMADLNHSLLQRLTMEAPGTYHHSLVVANLSESAASAIGANPLQCRVCAYFHDIGKLVKPEYFSENQQGEDSPHNELEPSMSALIISSHVKEGVDLALKHKLPKPIVDAIREHHGTTLVSFFHARALQWHRDAIEGGKIMNMSLREGDVPEVSEQTFRYAGPKPHTRETAILMLSDCVEGASRSLDKPTPQRIEEMVQSIIYQKLEDGQLDECPISMMELKRVAEKLVFTLKTMMHSRIAYPKEDKEENEKNTSNIY